MINVIRRPQLVAESPGWNPVAVDTPSAVTGRSDTPSAISGGRVMQFFTHDVSF